MIPYSRQNITKKDIAAVKKVLNSDFLTQGPELPLFEKSVSKYCGVNYAVGVNSATSALHIACLALGLTKGDWLWTSPNTFVASANCGLYCGANINFVDIDSKTYNISIEKLTYKLEKAERKGELPKILIPVHFAGQSCDMEKIYLLSQRYGFKIIEDASHAVGAFYDNKKVGSCNYSDITVFSFHPVKIITSGEGGMALTNNEYLFNKMIRTRSHGVTLNKNEMHQRPKNEIWNYQQVELGFNYRMNDIQAALGSSQLKNLRQFVNKRRKIAERYDNELSNLDIILPWQLPKSRSSYHLYPIQIKDNKNKINQLSVYNKLRYNQVGVNLHYIPVHRHPYYEKLGFKKNDFPEAEKFYSKTISLPIFPNLKKKQQEMVISSLRSALS